MYNNFTCTPFSQFSENCYLYNLFYFQGVSCRFDIARCLTKEGLSDRGRHICWSLWSARSTVLHGTVYSLLLECMTACSFCGHPWHNRTFQHFVDIVAEKSHTVFIIQGSIPVRHTVFGYVNRYVVVMVLEPVQHFTQPKWCNLQPVGSGSVRHTTHDRVTSSTVLARLHLCPCSLYICSY